MYQVATNKMHYWIMYLDTCYLIHIMMYQYQYHWHQCRSVPKSLIFYSVFISQFSINHFSLCSVLVLSSFINFSSYSVLVQSFAISSVYIHFSFLLKQFIKGQLHSYSILLQIIVALIHFTRWSASERDTM